MESTKFESRRILREKERAAVTGVPTSSWYAMQAKGLAPRPVRLTAKSVGWYSDEVDAWIHARERAGKAAA